MLIEWTCVGVWCRGVLNKKTGRQIAWGRDWVHLTESFHCEGHLGIGNEACVVCHLSTLSLQKLKFNVTHRKCDNCDILDSLVSDWLFFSLHQTWISLLKPAPTYHCSFIFSFSRFLYLFWLDILCFQFQFELNSIWSWTLKFVTHCVHAEFIKAGLISSDIFWTVIWFTI